MRTKEKAKIDHLPFSTSLCAIDPKADRCLRCCIQHSGEGFCSCPYSTPTLWGRGSSGRAALSVARTDPQPMIVLKCGHHCICSESTAGTPLLIAIRRGPCLLLPMTSMTNQKYPA